MPYCSINPATGEVLKTFNEHTDKDLMSTWPLRTRHFTFWAARPFSERPEIIGRAAQLLLEKKEERFAPLKMGKRIAESL